MIERWPNMLLVWLQVKRPHLWPLVEAIVYERRSAAWVRRKYGREMWEELVGAVVAYLRRNPYY